MTRWALATVIIACFVATPLASGYQTTFYFHNNRELSISITQVKVGGLVLSIQARPTSQSARAYEESNANAASGTGSALQLTSQIYVAGQQSGYVALVAWFAKAFTSKVKLDGDVMMHVWMSSSDGLWPWEGSLYFMGVGDYSPASSTVEILGTYVSSGVSGNILASSPQEYFTMMRINQHDFETGNRLMFFAGAGSTKQGWKFTIYFDSATWNSRVEIPADPTLTVPEFGKASIVLVLSTIAFQCFRRKLGHAPQSIRWSLNKSG